MKRTLLAVVLAILPVATVAFDFQHGDDDYTDNVRFSLAEQAAISLLTSEGIVSGNPDGSFAVHRTLNRAEFLKIALLSTDATVTASDAASCFPDVPTEAWFSRFVCYAKVQGIVEGNPDGLFHPERAVNYAEALKILTGLFEYDLPTPPANERWTWYRAYILAAEQRGTALPGTTDAGHELVRGDMARLAAAFVAESGGELETYRDAERGIFDDVSSSSLSSSSASSQSSLSSSSVSSSVSSVSSSPSSSSSVVSLYPAKNSFFLTGKRSPLVLGGTVVSEDEASVLRVAQFTLRREVTSIDKVYLVDSRGDTIAELILATNNNSDKRKWEVTVPESAYTFAMNTPTKVGVVFLLKPKDGGGGSNQLIETESFKIQTEGVTTGNTKYLFTDVQVYPVHQTAFGRLTRATSTLPTSGTIQAGARRQIASVRVTAETATGGTVSVQGVEFLTTLADLTLSNIVIGDAAKGQLVECGFEKQERIIISCGLLPEQLSTIPATGLTVSVYADLALTGPGNGYVALKLEDRGRIGLNGSFTWGDESGRFTWIEEGIPFGGDTSWTVIK